MTVHARQMGHNGLHAGGGGGGGGMRGGEKHNNSTGAMVFHARKVRYSYSVHIGACRTGGERRFHVDTDTVIRASRALQWENPVRLYNRYKFVADHRFAPDADT
jgi:hypothetical protein